MIGVIGAMQQEIDAILRKLENVSEKDIYNHKFLLGNINNKEIVLCKSGVGKVNASITTTLMITNFNIDYIINIGTSGGLIESQETLDIVISEKVIQHDYDTSYLDGESGRGIFVNSDEQLKLKIKEAFEKNKIDANIYFGDIISGDLFVGETKKIIELKKLFPTAIACEMEAGAIGQTCEKLGVKFIVIRSLSDIVFHDNSNIDFLKNVELTSKRSAEMLEAFLK